MLVLIRGAGDIASGIALRLRRAGFGVVMTEIEHPTTIRRTVSFSEAVTKGEQQVEEVTAIRAGDAEEALKLIAAGFLPVLVDEACACCGELHPDALVDAILAKWNVGTTMRFAPVVVGIGPGFTAGIDCHAVVETMRGHTLGRVYYAGSAMPNTNIPGLIGGFAGERVLRAPADGVFFGSRMIGEHVKRGDVVGSVSGVPMRATLSGVLRGLLADGVRARMGMKAGDVDPRDEASYCYSASDKALAVGGGVLEAILHFQRFRPRR